MKINIIIGVLLLTITMGCGTGGQNNRLNKEQKFIQNINSFCDKELEGHIIADIENPDNEGTTVAFEMGNCIHTEARMSFTLPGGVEKTIVLTLLGEEILLKHDIRNADLSPAPYTMYGGFSITTGTEVAQIFPVHNFGQSMWPGFEEYSWEIRIKDNKLEYFERDGEVVRKHYLISAE